MYQEVGRTLKVQYYSKPKWPPSSLFFPFFNFFYYLYMINHYQCLILAMSPSSSGNDLENSHTLTCRLSRCWTSIWFFAPVNEERTVYGWTENVKWWDVKQLLYSHKIMTRREIWCFFAPNSFLSHLLTISTHI